MASDKRPDCESRCYDDEIYLIDILEGQKSSFQHNDAIARSAERPEHYEIGAVLAIAGPIASERRP